ncbi:MAG: hypothetical protein M3R35_02140 [Candidatus Eremiobacteraeota bacterium]|nr:hypothetical protein [Candidatus Eremiobacteraeota bacterium]
MNVNGILKTAILAGAFAAGTVGVSAAQTIPSNMVVRPAYGQHVRGERGSLVNLMRERRRLETVIDSLQRDNHDYGGHRVQAVDSLVQARAHLDEAIEYDRAHPQQ